jgi:hypothetical protein
MNDQACVIDHGTDKNGYPRRAEAWRGLLCKNHASRLAEWLQEIAVDFTLLETVVRPGQTGTERRADSHESAPPLNLAVVSLRDSDRVRAVRDRGDELWYELPDIPAVLPTLRTRAEDIRCLLDPAHDHDSSVWDTSVIAEINYLIAAFDTLCGADFIPEAFADIKQLWVALQRAHNRPQPRRLGHCLSVDCDGTVWPRPKADPWCSKCKRIYDSPAEWAKIAIQEDKRKKAAAENAAKAASA